MKKISNERIAGSHCHETMTVQRALDLTEVSWPYKNWILYTCDACDRSNHLEVTRNTVKVGEIDGAPGPCFIVSATHKVRDFKVSCSEKQMRITGNGYVWLIPAR